jgi:hypothetical protein
MQWIHAVTYSPEPIRNTPIPDEKIEPAGVLTKILRLKNWNLPTKRAPR